jgi:hypothetical protein
MLLRQFYDVSSCTGLVTPDTKRQCGGKSTNTTPSSNDLTGNIVYNDTNMMPTVNKKNLFLCLCAARQHVGRDSPCGDLCMMIHDMDISKRPNSTLAKCLALVNRTPALK